MTTIDVLEIIISVISSLAFLFAVDRIKLQKKQLPIFITSSSISAILLILLNVFSFYIKLNEVTELWYVLTILFPELGILIIINILLHRKIRIIELLTSTLNAFLCFYMMYSLDITFSPYNEHNKLFALVVYLVTSPILFVYLRFVYRKLQNIVITFIPNKLWVLSLYTAAVTYELIAYASFLKIAPNRFIQFSVFGVFLLLVYFVSIFCFFLFLNDYKNQSLQLMNLESNKKQLSTILSYAKKQKQNEEQLRIVKHDMRHVLNNIATLLQEGNKEKALEIISTYNEIVDSSKFTNYCHDPAINAIINFYKNKCEDNHIVFETVVHNFEDNLKVPIEDLSLIISNILDNAYNATIKVDKPFINFKFINNHGQLLLQVSNSYNGQIFLDSDNLPMSYESNHGTGSKSIKYYTKKNNLLVDYEITNNEFKISILF